VRLFRVSLFAFAAVMLAVTYVPRLRLLLSRTAGVFILAVGAFCIGAIAYSAPDTVTPFFTGL